MPRVLYWLRADEAVLNDQFVTKLCAGKAKDAIGKQESNDRAVRWARSAGTGEEIPLRGSAQPWPRAADECFAQTDNGGEIGVAGEHCVGDSIGERAVSHRR
ncbi:MAG TPA: hypothetical protein VF126_02690 [Acidobacteriaceae bacterium]